MAKIFTNPSPVEMVRCNAWISIRGGQYFVNKLYPETTPPESKTGNVYNLADYRRKPKLR